MPDIHAAAPAATLSRARLWRTRGICFALFLANGFVMGTWAGNLPRLREAEALSAGELGLVLLCFGIGAVLAMPTTARLAGRHGAARVAAVSGIALALLFPFIPHMPGFLALCALAALAGAANGTMDVAMNAEASLVERAWGAAIMSSFHALWSAGGLLGAAAAGALAHLDTPLGWSFAIATICFLPFAVTGLAVAPHPGERVSGPAFALPGRNVAVVSAVAALCFAAEGAIADWSGVFLRTDRGTDVAFAASAYAAYAVAMAFGRATGDWVVRRLGPGRVLLGGTLAGALGVAVFLLVPDLWAANLGLVVAGLGLSNVVPVAFSAAGRISGTAGVAAAATTGYAGLLIAPPLLGGLAELLGLAAALWGGTLMILAMAPAAGAVAVKPDGNQAGRV